MSLLYEAWRRVRGEEARLDAVLGVGPPGVRRSMGKMPWAGWLLAVVLAAMVGALASYVWWSRRAPAPAARIQSMSAKIPLKISTSSGGVLKSGFRDTGAPASGKTTGQGAVPVVATGVASQVASEKSRPVAPGGALRASGPAILLASAPASIRESFPPVKVVVHVWNSSASQRLVMIGSQTYRIGDEIAPGVRLVDITRTGEIVSYHGYRLILPGG